MAPPDGTPSWKPRPRSQTPRTLRRRRPEAEPHLPLHRQGVGELRDYSVVPGVQGVTLGLLRLDKKGEGPTDGLLEEAYLANVIYDIWAKSRRRYGSPRVTLRYGSRENIVREERGDA